MYEAATKIIDKHGLAAAFAIGILVLLFFVGKRFVAAVDAMSANAQKVANAVNESSAAQIRAFSALTDRVSRVEGTIHALGLAALGMRPGSNGDQPAQSQTAHVRSVIAEHAADAEEYGDTPIQEVPEPTKPAIPSVVKRKPQPTPPKGSPYAIHNRAATQRGK